MRRKTRTKVKRILMIAGIIVGIILIIIGIIFAVKLSKRPTVSYKDVLVGKNYFIEMTINMNTKEVIRDDKKTSLTKEFDITQEKETTLLNSEEEMQNFLNQSVFEVTENNRIFTIKNKFQTKNIIVEADEIKEKIEGEEITKITDSLYVLSFNTEKLTKAMYNYYKDKDYVKRIFLDEIFIDEPINDVSQTMFGETEVDLKNYHSLGATSLGLDNYANIINENQNAKNIVIATIGYGVNYNHEIFNNRLTENYYNFILNNNDISETIAQGSRIAEVLVDSTTANVKLMPLVTVTSEGYTSISSIVKAIKYGVINSDVICYELINKQNEIIDIALQDAFQENKPVCCVASSEKENYPAIHGMTIATSSVDRNMEFADYSAKGSYIDFAAPSTDIEEIFSSSGGTLSRWSGTQYSNAQIVAMIALIKTYNKEATILDVYNFLRNYCIDLGEERQRRTIWIWVSKFYGFKNFGHR